MSRNRSVGAVAAALAFAASTGIAPAQDYPARPITAGDGLSHR